MSGKRPSAFRDHSVTLSTRTSKTPPVPGLSATSPISCSNVVNSSCAIQAARSSHRHWVQYSISTRAGSAMPPSYRAPRILSPPLTTGRGPSTLSKRFLVHSDAGSRVVKPISTPREPRVPAAFLFVPSFPRDAPPAWWRSPERELQKKEVDVNGNRYCQVVQRREGLRLHHPGG